MTTSWSMLEGVALFTFSPIPTLVLSYDLQLLDITQNKVPRHILLKMLTDLYQFIQKLKF